jgi:hypothetical protein
MSGDESQEYANNADNWGVYDVNTHPMQTARYLVGTFIKFSPCMEDGHHNLKCTLPVLGHEINGNSPPIILDGTGTIPADSDENEVAKGSECFIDRVIDYLIHQMVEAPVIGTPDIHCWALSYRFETLQYGDMRCIISLAHGKPP